MLVGRGGIGFLGLSPDARQTQHSVREHLQVAPHCDGYRTGFGIVEFAGHAGIGPPRRAADGSAPALPGEIPPRNDQQIRLGGTVCRGS